MAKPLSSDSVYEFEWLDPQEMHLVGTPANGFIAPLLAKTAEAVENEMDEAWSEDGLVKYVSAAARRKYAKTGVAMPNGDFPIPDEGHLRSAIGRLGNYKGNKEKAKRHIIRRARALGLTHLLPKEWNVKKTIAEDRHVPMDEAEDQTREVDMGPGPKSDGEPDDGGTPRHVTFRHRSTDDGEGDTAPDKHVPMSEAETQTRSMKRAVDMEGSKAPDGEAEAREAEGEADDQPGLETYEHSGGMTPEEREAEAYARKRKGGANTPGSPAWEHKDVALGEKAEDLVRQLAQVIRTFTQRERAEGGAPVGKPKKKARKVALLEEIGRMPSDELRKLFADELKAARRAEAKKAKKQAKKQAKKALAKEGVMDTDATNDKAQRKAKKLAKAAKKAAKANDLAALEQVAKEIQAIKETVEKVAKQEARRVTVNAAGVAAVARSPEARTSVLKELEDQAANAENPREQQLAKQQLAMAKMVFNENARQRNPGLFVSDRGPGSVRLFTSGLEQLPPDPAIKGR